MKSVINPWQQGMSGSAKLVLKAAGGPLQSFFKLNLQETAKAELLCKIF